MISSSFSRCRSTVVPFLAVCCTLFAVLLLQISPVRADTLSPQRIQELTDLGARIADRERAMKEAEQQLQRPDLSPADRERLTKEVGDHRDFIKTTKDGIAAQGADQKRVLDRAIEARTKQYQLKDAKAAAAKDPSDKKAQRTVKRLETELQSDYKDLGKLPTLASTAIPGTSSNLAAGAVVLDECRNQGMLSSGLPLPYVLAGASRLDGTSARVAVRSASHPFLHIVQRGGGMTQVDDLTLPPDVSGPQGTSIKGKVPDVVIPKGSGAIIKPNGPGTIEFSDKDGKSRFFRVEKDGTYSGWFPPDFKPVKAELKTGSEQDIQTKRWVIQDGKMHEIGVVDYSNVPDPGSRGRIITGSLPVGTRGTLELTDKNGKSHWFHVDEKGNYSGKVETPDFKPVKAELQTGPDMQNIRKLKWTIPENGWWRPIDEFPPTPQTADATGPIMQGTASPQALNVAFTGTYKPKRKPGKETQTADILTPRIAVTFEGTDENSETFVAGKDIPWTGIDCKKIGLTYGLPDKTFSIGAAWTRDELKTYQNHYTHANVYGASVPTADLRYYVGSQRITVPQLATGIPDLPAQGFGGTSLSQADYPIMVGVLIVDNRHSFIKGVPKNTNAWRLSEDFVRGGLPGMDAWSRDFLTPSGNRLYTYGLDSPAQADQVAQIAGNRIDYIENNEDDTAAPAGWLPSSWPRTQAQALPSFRISIKREAP